MLTGSCRFSPETKFWPPPGFFLFPITFGATAATIVLPVQLLNAALLGLHIITAFTACCSTGVVVTGLE